MTPKLSVTGGLDLYEPGLALLVEAPSPGHVCSQYIIKCYTSISD